MELWIRSQDRKDLISTRSLCMTKGDYEEIGIFANGIIIGTYKTKERALEVLDEIQRLLNPMLIFENCECSKDVLDSIRDSGACYVTDNARLEQINTCVYEMPKE